MGVIRKSALVGYVLGCDVAGGQEYLGLTDPRGTQIGVRCGPQGLPKDADEIILAEMEGRRQFGQGGRALQILGQTAYHMIHQPVPLAADLATEQAGQDRTEQTVLDDPRSILIFSVIQLPKQGKKGRRIEQAPSGEVGGLVAPDAIPEMQIEIVGTVTALGAVLKESPLLDVVFPPRQLYGYPPPR